MGESRPGTGVREIGVIKGDGIGPELVDAAMAVMEAALAGQELSLRFVEIDAGAGTWRRTGAAIGPEGIDTVRRAAATLKGPVGLPGVTTPEGTEAGLLGGVLREGLDLFVNFRPIALLDGVESCLRLNGRTIDYAIVRENTEGLYASRGKGVGNRWAVADTLIATRAGTERVVRWAFDLARRRMAARGTQARVTCVDKANVLRSSALFREVYLEAAATYPDLEVECMYVDAAAQALVVSPEHFDVIVTENLMGDILSDLGGGTVGGVAMCPSGNLGTDCAYFEPIHGSAPALAGRAMANPTGEILAAAMLLEYVGAPVTAEHIRAAMGRALASGAVRLERDGTARGGPGAVSRAVIEELG